MKIKEEFNSKINSIERKIIYKLRKETDAKLKCI